MLKKLRFFIPISFFQIMWLPLWEDKSIKQLTISGLATRAPAPRGTISHYLKVGADI